MRYKMNKDFPSDILIKIHCNFSKLILKRVKELSKIESFALPTKEDVELSFKEEQWFPVEGMYGGFKYKVIYDQSKGYVLISTSWCRVMGGSGQTHEITENGCTLIEVHDY